MLHPLLLADAFGVVDYPRIYGLGALTMVVGVGAGPLVVGVIRDAAGGYGPAFSTMAIVAFVGLAVLRATGPKPTDRPATDSSRVPV